MCELMTQLRRSGLQTPDPHNLPPIAWHPGPHAFTGETMEQAFKAGAQHFRGSRVKIIFVLLGEAGKHPYPHIPEHLTMHLHE